MNAVTGIEMEGQIAGGARGICGLRSATRTIGSIAGVGVTAMARVKSSVTATTAGPARICTQHCVPQPAAQAQPLS